MSRVFKMKTIVILMTLISSSILFQSCATGKGCGCGNDINKNYKARRR
ncbi:MAG TPA: hypothetical protein PLQ78_01210 [Flavipsychrobacter sp.]|nr:hypothetical protein [Flavipsychrobacter sp.]